MNTILWKSRFFNFYFFTILTDENLKLLTFWRRSRFDGFLQYTVHTHKHTQKKFPHNNHKMHRTHRFFYPHNCGGVIWWFELCINYWLIMLCIYWLMAIFLNQMMHPQKIQKQQNVIIIKIKLIKLLLYKHCWHGLKLLTS